MGQGLRAGVVLPYRATLSVHCLASAGLPWNYANPFHAKYLIADKRPKPSSQKQGPAVLDKRPDRGPCAKVLFTVFYYSGAPRPDDRDVLRLFAGGWRGIRCPTGARFYHTIFATANSHTPTPF
jgi:hypothetical protein